MHDGKNDALQIKIGRRKLSLANISDNQVGNSLARCTKATLATTMHLMTMIIMSGKGEAVREEREVEEEEDDDDDEEIVEDR